MRPDEIAPVGKHTGFIAGVAVLATAMVCVGYAWLQLLGTSGVCH